MRKASIDGALKYSEDQCDETEFIMAMKSLLYLECHWLMPYALHNGNIEVTKYTLDFDTKWYSAFSILTLV